MFLTIMHAGPYKHAVYKCDACGIEYTVFGQMGGEMCWCEPYNEEYCHKCFVKVPGAEPIFRTIDELPEPD